MRSLRFAGAMLALMALGACASASGSGGGDSAKAIAAAIADPGRPGADRARDGDRHPQELAAFAEVGPGQKIADYMPGGGYFTRIFAKAAGPTGHVHAVFPEFMARLDKRDADAVQVMAKEPGYANVSYDVVANDGFQVGEGRLDLVWTSDNYHDLQFGLTHDRIIALDKAILAALKPGGVFLVIDHAAAPGTGWSVARTLHRIDKEAIKADMAEAGFVLDGESQLLANPKDPHTAIIFDPAIRGRTDQIVLRFRRPK
jgi:predicted methyltransferase